MGRSLNVDWQHSKQTLRDRYLEETDHQDRTRLHALWLVRKGREMSEVAEILDVCYESFRRWTQSVVPLGRLEGGAFSSTRGKRGKRASPF